MRDFIKNILVDVHTGCSTDKYGQMSKFNLSMYGLFKEKTEEVEEWLKTNPILEVSTYGGSYGTYRAITNILDPEIKELCDKAFMNNPNHIRNLNTY